MLKLLIFLSCLLLAQDMPRQVVSSKFKKKRTESVQAAAATVPDADDLTMIGVNLWKGRLPRPSDGSRARALVLRNGKGVDLIPELVRPDATFKKGDNVRIEIEAGRHGHLYLLNQELCGKKAHETLMIFPSQHLRKGQTKVGPTIIVDVPNWSDSPPFFELDQSCKPSVDRIFILFALTPIPELKAGSTPLLITEDELERYRKLYYVPSPKRSVASQKRLPTAGEVDATQNGKPLPAEAPIPQTVFLVDQKHGRPVMVSMDLRVE